MTGPSLFDLPPASHHPGLETEHEAEDAYRATRLAHVARARALLEAAGAYGLTKHELDAATGWVDSESSRRLWDLRQLGEAVLLLQRRIGPNRRSAHVCVLTPYTLGRLLA